MDVGFRLDRFILLWVGGLVLWLVFALFGLLKFGIIAWILFLGLKGSFGLDFGAMVKLKYD